MKFLSVRDLRGKAAKVWKDLPEEKDRIRRSLFPFPFISIRFAPSPRGSTSCRPSSCNAGGTSGRLF